MRLVFTSCYNVSTPPAQILSTLSVSSLPPSPCPLSFSHQPLFSAPPHLQNGTLSYHVFIFFKDNVSWSISFLIVSLLFLFLPDCILLNLTSQDYRKLTKKSPFFSPTHGIICFCSASKKLRFLLLIRLLLLQFYSLANHCLLHIDSISLLQ